MLKKLTWLELLDFLQNLHNKGKTLEDDVLLYDVDTGDIQPCDMLEIDNKLMLSINWDSIN